MRGEAKQEARESLICRLREVGDRGMSVHFPTKWLVDAKEQKTDYNRKISVTFPVGPPT